MNAPLSKNSKVLIQLALISVLATSCFGGLVYDYSNTYLYNGKNAKSQGAKVLLNLFSDTDLAKDKIILPLALRETYSAIETRELSFGATHIFSGKGRLAPGYMGKSGERGYYAYYGGGVRLLTGDNIDYGGYYLNAGFQAQLNSQFWLGLELTHCGGIGGIDYIDDLGNPQTDYFDGLRLGVGVTIIFPKDVRDFGTYYNNWK